jgi:hypothetical protein
MELLKKRNEMQAQVGPRFEMQFCEARRVNAC